MSLPQGRGLPKPREIRAAVSQETGITQKGNTHIRVCPFEYSQGAAEILEKNERVAGAEKR